MITGDRYEGTSIDGNYICRSGTCTTTETLELLLDLLNDGGEIVDICYSEPCQDKEEPEQQGIDSWYWDHDIPRDIGKLHIRNFNPHIWPINSARNV